MRVVSLVPSATETLLTLGVAPVACTRFCEQPGIPTVGGTKSPAVTSIVDLRPDLVVMNDEENRREDYEALRDAGLRVHSMSPRSLGDVARRRCAPARWSGPALVGYPDGGGARQSARRAALSSAILPGVDRIRNSWELGKISWSVLRSDRSLAWFPVLSAIASLAIIGIFAALVGVTGIDTESNKEALKPIGYIFIVFGYIGMAFVTTYFLAALVHGANERLQGRDTSVGSSMAAANAKLHRILPWALVQATVSIILQAIEERFGIVGRIVASLLGAAWAVVTFLTVPIIMLEDVGPVAALKRSGQLLKQTWGENIIGQGGFGLLGFVAMLPAILLVVIAASGGTAFAIAFGVVAAVWIAIVLVVLSAMTGIYRVALYRYAVDGVAPQAFAGADLPHAFKQR